MCNCAEEKQTHRCDPYGLRVQEQPLFLVCSRIVFLLLWIKSHRSKNIDAWSRSKIKVVHVPLGHKDHNGVLGFLQHHYK